MCQSVASKQAAASAATASQKRSEETPRHEKQIKHKIEMLLGHNQDQETMIIC